MKCPCCGKDMEKGFVQSTRRLFFNIKEFKHFWEDIDQKDSILLSSNNWTNPTAIAYNCQDCKKVVIDYTNVIE